MFWFFGVFLLTACQTAGRHHTFADGGETYSRDIVTDPSDAEISIDGTPIGKAPLTLSLTAPRYTGASGSRRSTGALRDPFDDFKEPGSVPPPDEHDPSYIEYRNALQRVHVLTVRKPGYEDREIPFSMETMQEAIPGTITLRRSRAPAGAESGSETQERTLRPGAGGRENEVPAPETADYGYLTIVSEPTNAEVFVGDDMIGVTPLAHVLLEAGTHQLILKHPGYKKWTYWVQILPGSTTTLQATMEE